jgi:hypothetical protein
MPRKFSYQAGRGMALRQGNAHTLPVYRREQRATQGLGHVSTTTDKQPNSERIVDERTLQGRKVAEN